MDAGERIVDLDGATRDALEFDAVLLQVAEEARTPPGRRALLARVPCADRGLVERRLAAAEEVRRFVTSRERLVPSRLPDPEPALTILAMEDARPPARALRDLALYLVFGEELKRRIESAVEQDAGFEALVALAASIPDVGAIGREIVAAIDPEGRLEDRASERLAAVRREAARTGARLRADLERWVRSPAAASSVQDEFVTQRNGRFVIPVRADASRGVRGIVHATSSSGATLFVEPLESVEANNRLVALREAEAEEVDRIVRRWAERLRARGADIARVVECAARADALQAIAAWAVAAEAERARIAGPGEGLVLEDIRHPLLDRRLKDAGNRGAVPISIVIDPWDRALVLSGPNTGGKTVALKTLGLAVLMTQSGIPVPARVARLPVYGQVRADIGDHQSLEADLSTFSAHLEAVRGFLEGLRPPALLLFDEVGTGTDPAEGAALAIAVLEHLLREHVTVAATTHHGAVKAWAFETDGVVSAALDFDRVGLRPTYRVLMGVAGVSAGIDVAERLGLDAAVVRRARARLGPDAARAERYLERLRESLADLERRGRELDERAATLDRARASVDAEIEREVRRARDAAAARFEESVRSFRELGRSRIEQIADRAAREAARRALGDSERRLAAEAARRRDRMKSVPARALVEEDPGAPIGSGSAVVVVSMDREGVVERVRGNRVEVRLGKVTFQVPRSDVRPATASTAAPEVREAPRSRSRAVERDDLRAGTPLELHVIGRTVDEALPEVERFLDRAVRDGLAEVRIVHGHGTGRLRAAVREHLRRNPLARSMRPGRRNEGGDGATVVVLGERPD